MKTFRNYLAEVEAGFNYTSALAPDQTQLNNNSLDAMSKGMVDAVKQLPPEYQNSAQQFIVKDVNGDIDGDETMMKMFQGMADIAPQLYKVFDELTTKMEATIKSPDFAKQYPDPAEQQELIKDVADMRAQMPELKAAADKSTAEFGKIRPQMRQAVDQRANSQFKAQTGNDMVRTSTGAKTNIGTNPNQPGGGSGGQVGESTELARWLKIAGIK